MASASFARSGSRECCLSNSVSVRWSMDLPMISSPTRFMTASMRAASTRRVLSAAVAVAESRCLGSAVALDVFDAASDDLGGLFFEQVTEQFVLWHLRSGNLLDVNLGHDRRNTAAVKQLFVGLCASEGGLDNFDVGCGHIIFRTQGNDRTASVKNIANELEGRGSHQTVRINAKGDVVNRVATMNSFGNHELLVFRPSELPRFLHCFGNGLGGALRSLQQMPNHFVKCVYRGQV